MDKSCIFGLRGFTAKNNVVPEYNMQNANDIVVLSYCDMSSRLLQINLDQVQNWLKIWRKDRTKSL